MFADRAPRWLQMLNVAALTTICWFAYIPTFIHGNEASQQELSWRLEKGDLREYKLVTDEHLGNHVISCTLSMLIASPVNGEAVCNLRLVHVSRDGVRNTRLLNRLAGSFHIDTTMDTSRGFDPQTPVSIQQRRLLALAFPFISGIHAVNGETCELKTTDIVGSSIRCTIDQVQSTQGGTTVSVVLRSTDAKKEKFRVRGSGSYSVTGGFWRKTSLQLVSVDSTTSSKATFDLSLSRTGTLSDDALKSAAIQLELRKKVSSAYGLLTKGMADEAVATIQAAVRKWPNLDHIELHAAVICATAGRLEESRAYIKKELAVNPQFYPALTAACEIYLRSDDQKAVESLRARMSALEKPTE